MKFSIMEELMRGEMGRILEFLSPETKALQPALLEKYDEFLDTLTPEQQTLYKELEDAELEGIYSEQLRRFRFGFRTGLLLGLEIFQMNIKKE